jgi:hypothetical protein
VPGVDASVLEDLRSGFPRDAVLIDEAGAEARGRGTGMSRPAEPGAVVVGPESTGRVLR